MCPCCVPCATLQVFATGELAENIAAKIQKGQRVQVTHTGSYSLCDISTFALDPQGLMPMFCAAAGAAVVTLRRHHLPWLGWHASISSFTTVLILIIGDF